MRTSATALLAILTMAGAPSAFAAEKSAVIGTYAAIAEAKYADGLASAHVLGAADPQSAGRMH